MLANSAKQNQLELKKNILNCESIALPEHYLKRSLHWFEKENESTTN